MQHKRVAWTLYQDSQFYKIFRYVRLLCCVISVFLYPIYIIMGFPEMLSPNFLVLWTVETFFLIDIIMNFFLQKVNEQGNHLNQTLGQICE